MTTKEFLQVAPKITKTGLFYNLKKGEQGQWRLGFNIFGSTDSHYQIIWRKYGTLENMVITEPAEDVNVILKKEGITEFIAKPTKSGRFCRLVEVK
ncbi:hypothetical protein CMT52_18045 [Elizabethkingia anophelis]|nr:hypothetical protein [Elizabethkingia anophelis]